MKSGPAVGHALCRCLPPFPATRATSGSLLTGRACALFDACVGDERTRPAYWRDF